MEKSYKYTVAGHTFSVFLPEGYSQEDCLRPYAPFEAFDDDVLFSLRVRIVEDLHDVLPGKVVDCLNQEAPYLWLFQPQDGSMKTPLKFNFGFSYSKSRPDCILVPAPDLKDNVVYLPAATAKRSIEFAISNSMMLLYTYCTAPYETLMVHASVVAHKGGGYMFLGRSGTGKSTHSSLWLRNFSENTYLLNDDNPVIRVLDGHPYVYGTPWSGKTPCYKCERVPLFGVVRLSQAPENKISRLPLLNAYASLMPACSCMRWDRASTDALHHTVEAVISQTACWHLQCLPDDEAAHVCNSAVVI